LASALAEGIHPQASAATLEPQITALLADALAAPDHQAAEARLREAEGKLRAARGRLGELAGAFLDAELRRVRGQVWAMACQRGGADEALREKARRALSDAVAELGRLQKLAEDRADAIERQLADADPVGNARWREAVAYASRANYGMAWATYNLGKLAPEGQREGHFKQAVEKFLGFTAEGYRPHPIVVDCFLGQALCLHELGRFFELTQLLEQALRGDVPPKPRRRLTYLLLRTYRAQSAPEPSLKLENRALSYFDGLPPDHRYDGVDLDMALMRARNLDALAKAMPDYAKALTERLDAVARLLFTHGDPWASELAKTIGRSPQGKPFLSLIQARKHFNATRYAEAIDAAASGLAAADAKTPTSVAADLRYVRAAAAWNLKRWRQAHDAAFDLLQHHRGDRRAPSLCRRALQAALEARKAEPPLPDGDYIRFLNFAEAHFPNEPEVQRAPWYRASMLIDGKEFAKARAVLRRVPPASPIYRLAQYGLALAGHREAEAVAEADHNDVESERRPFLRNVPAVSRCLALLSGGLSDEERPLAQSAAEIALATAQQILGLPKPAHEAARKLLDQTEALDGLGADLAARRLALRIQAHLAAGQLDHATRRIDAVLDGKRLDEPLAQALLRAADPLEREWDRLEKAGSRNEARELAHRLARLYTALLDHARRGQEIALRRRLAQALTRAGSHRDAVLHYEWLRARVPRESSGDVLRGLALAHEAARNYDAAIAAWRTLSKGLQARSEPWLEARYHLIRCHLKAGRRDRARKLLDYLRLQCPRLEAGALGPQFRALDRELPPPKGP
jgi:hypothetical protein